MRKGIDLHDVFSFEFLLNHSGVALSSVRSISGNDRNLELKHV